MRRVPASDVEGETLSVIRATAAALGLPLLVLEARDDGRFPVTLGPAGDSADRALVLVTHLPSREAAETSAAPLSLAHDGEVGIPPVSPPPRSAVSGEGGIIRFTLGDRDEKVAS
jgi:hypothetical protein